MPFCRSGLNDFLHVTSYARKDPFHYIPWGLSKPNINDLWSVVLQKIFKELAKKYTKLPIIPSKLEYPHRI